jgi:hypothetical protein
MKMSKLAFTCVSFTFITPFVVSAAAPRANDAVVIAIDAFGRPVPGLELEVVLRGKDGALTRATEKPSAKTGKARVKLGNRTLADVNVKGDFDVAARTSWKEDDTRHIVLTVVPLLPFEARFSKRDGTPQKDAAVLLESPEWWHSGTTLCADGEDLNVHAFVSDADGVVRGKAPRGAEEMLVVLPGSFEFHPEQAAPVEGRTLRANASPLHALGHRFDLHLPNFSERTISWVDANRQPLVGVRWCSYVPALMQLPAYLERFASVSDASGIAPVLEAIDADGQFEREYNEETLVLHGDDTFRLYTPPVPESGLTGTLAVPAAIVDAPSAPEGYRWTWYARGHPDVRERVASGARPELSGSDNFLWAAPIGGDDFDHVVRFDARVKDALDVEKIECPLVETKVDLSKLPAGRWSIESRTVLVDEEDVYLDVNDNVVLDAEGRALTFGTFDVDYSELHANGPGLAAARVTFTTSEDGSITTDTRERSLDLRCVRADGSPASYVCFTAHTRSPDSLLRGTDTRPAWTDGDGRAVLFVDHEDGFVLEVQLRTQERLLGTRFTPTVDPSGVVTLTLPDLGRLSIDGPAVVGGEPRPLVVRFAPHVEGDERPVSRRDGASRTMLTNTDGTLVIDDVPVGAYVFQISETAIMSPSLGGLHRVDVAAMRTQR